MRSQPETMSNPDNFQYDPGTNYDEATMAQQRQIEKEIAEAQPLVGGLETFEILEKEYSSDDAIYRQKIKDLQSKYSNFRRTRGDGNCFYRAYGFAYMERLLRDHKEFERFKLYAQKSKESLVEVGFQPLTIEDFHEVFMEIIEKVGSQCSLEELRETFNDQGYSDYLVVYLRLLVSAHLQSQEDFYVNFVEGGRTVREFCSQEVEPMGKESDHIHIIALTAATSVPVRIEYMDRIDSQTVIAHDFPEGSNPDIILLYRPGHYDIIYK